MSSRKFQKALLFGFLVATAVLLAALPLMAQQDDRDMRQAVEAFTAPDISFNSEPEPTANLLSDNFESYLAPPWPANGWNWVRTAGTSTSTMWQVVAAMTFPTGTPHSGTHVGTFISFSLPAPNAARLYRTSGLDLSGFGGVNVDLNFWMYHDNGYSTSNDTLQPCVSTDGGTNWTLLGSPISRYSANNQWTLHTQSLNAYTGGSFTDVRVGLQAVSAYGNNIFIDDVSVTYPGPTLGLSNWVISDTCATGGPGHNNGIVDPGESVALNVTLVNSGDQPATGINAVLSVVAPATGITVTQANSSYADIAPTANGTNATPFEFTAGQYDPPCGTNINFNLHVTASGGFSWDIPISSKVGSNVTIFTENFSGATVPNPPAGWTFAAPPQANPWTTYTPSCTTNGMQCYYNATLASNAWAYSPGLSLTAGTIYTLNFNQRVGLASYPENLSVWCGSAIDPASQTIAIWSGTGLTNAACALRSGTFTVPVNGTYYIGFHCTSAANEYYVAVDDVSLSAPACNVCSSGCPPITLDPPALDPGEVGVAYSETVIASGGTAPYSYAVTSGALPDGLSMDASGNITGTPTTIGVYTFVVTATDSLSCTGTKQYTIEICDTITVNPAALPGGFVGVPYSQTFTSTGGVAPYSYWVTTGPAALPPGVTLSAAGVLSGIPTTIGTYTFQIGSRDAWGCLGYTGNLTVRICPVITLDPPALPDGHITVPFSQTITAAGGVAPYTYAITAGVPPTGISMDASGNITGTPTVSGSYPVTITATDADGCAGSRAYAFMIYPNHCGAFSITAPALGSDNTFWPSYHGQQTGRVTRNGVAAGCAGKAWPGYGAATGARTFDAYRFDNETCADACVSITLSTTCAPVANQIFAAAYDGTFDPANIVTNYIGDPGVSPVVGTPVTYGFTIPAGGSVVVVVHEVTPGAGCSTGYTLTMNGVPCYTGMPGVPTAAVATDACGLGGAGNANGEMDPGENITVTVTVGNVGEYTLESITATLTSPSPLITITQGNTTFPNIPVCGSAANDGPNFGFHLSGAASCGGWIPFIVHFTTNQGAFDRSFNLLVTPSSVPTLLSESFETWPLTGWTIVNNGGDCDWDSALTYYGRGNFTGGTGDCADADSDICGAGTTMNTSMISPVFDLSLPTYTGARLTFKSLFDYYAAGDTGDVDITTDGTSWTNMLHYAADAGPLTEVIDLTPYLGSATVQIRFTFVAPGWDFLWEVDDVLVTAWDPTACNSHTCCPTITLAPASLPNGVFGVPYAQTVSASGGTAPYAYTVISGVLPPGLTLDPVTGLISGIPNTGGVYPFGVMGQQADGCYGAAGYSIEIPCSTIIVTNPANAAGTAGTAFSEVFTQTGGLPPIVFSTTSALPAGLTLAADGTLSGTPTVTGTFPITVRATDLTTCYGTGPVYTLVIGCPAITVTNPAVSTGTVGVPFSQLFTQSGGLPGTAVDMAGDTGTYLSSIGYGAPGGSLIWITRFTPNPAHFPFVLNQVQGIFAPGNSAVGDDIRVIIMQDTDGDGDVTNATLVYEQHVTQQHDDGVTWDIFNLAAPPTLAGPGDVLIGFINVVPYAYPAPEDNAGAAGSLLRSYIGSFTAYPSAPEPMTEWPPADYFDLIDTACCPGNWMVRGIGMNNTWPVELTTADALPAGLTLALDGTLAGTPTASGLFPITVTATDVNGCTGIGPLYNLNISCAPPAPVITGDNTNTCPSLTVQLSTGVFASYQWNNDSGPIAGANAQTYDVTASGNYTVTVTDASGCPGTSPQHAVVIQSCSVPEVSGVIAAVNGPNVNITFNEVGNYYNIYVSASPFTHPFEVTNALLGHVSCDVPTVDNGATRTISNFDLSAGITGPTNVLFFLVTAEHGAAEGSLGSDSLGGPRTASDTCP